MDLVRVQGLNPTHAARELAIPIQTLNVWLRKAGWVKPAERQVPLPEDSAALKVRVAELEKQVRLLEMEEILKKVTATSRSSTTASAGTRAWGMSVRRSSRHV